MASFFIADIAFGVAVAFLAGIFGAGLEWGLAASCAVAFAALVLIFQSLKIFASWKLLVLFFCMSFCGALYYHWYVDVHAAKTHLPLGKLTSFLAIVSDEPRASAKFLILPTDAERPLAGALAVFAPLGGDFHYGDELRITGAIEPPKSAGDSPVVFPRSIGLIAEHKGFWLRERLIGFKSAVLEKFNEVLPPDAAALLGGETLGGTNGMSVELKKEMSASGTSYVVAMYGYKIAMMVFALEALLGGGVARRARFFLAFGLVILFVIMSGGNPSAVRGGAWAMLALAAIEAGRVFDPRNALAATALGMALWDPTVLTQAAFQLSFLSIIGILYLARPLENFFRWNRYRHQMLTGSGTADPSGLLFILRKATVLAVASLLPIIPIIANVFGDFSLMTFPSNVLIFPAVIPAMMLGSALAAAGFVSYYFAFAIAHLAEVILWYQLWIIKIFSRFVAPLPFQFDAVIVFVFYYALIILFMYRYGDR